MDNIKSSWKPEWQFDFSVHLSTHIMSAAHGQAVAVPAVIELVQGETQPVILTVSSSWAASGLIAQVIPPTVTPGGMAMLHIVVSASTPPGSYPFTLRGETQGTFKTSEDMVTVVVQAAPKSHENNNNQPKNETSQTSSAPLPVTKAHAAVSSQSIKKGRQNKPGVVRGLVAAVVVLAVVGTVLYMSRNIFHNDINSIAPGGSPTTTTYVGTQTFTIYSALGGAPETNTGTASVQVDSSGDVLGPVLFGKITNGVFTGQAQTSDGTVTPMTGTLSDGKFTASYQSSSHSWIWNLQVQ
jgi:hypothetical protein